MSANRSRPPDGDTTDAPAYTEIDAQEAVELARHLVGARRVSLLLPVDDPSELRIVASCGIPDEIVATARIQPGEGIAGLVMQTRQPLLVNGDRPDLRLRATVDYTTSSFISVPVLFEPYGCGVFNVADPVRGDAFSREDLARLQSLASLVARSLLAPRVESYRRDAQTQRAHLHQQLLQAQETERGRLARDLHDEAGHTLATAIFRLDLEARRLAPESAPAAALARAREALMTCANALHDLAFTLHPRILTDLGLVPALRSLIAQVAEMGHLTIDLTIDEPTPHLSPEMNLAVFRVVQEALTNVRKHAATDRAWVVLSFADDQLQLCVEDRGVGLGAELLAGQSQITLGLGGMRERVELLGGTFSLTVGSAGGLIVSARLPLADEAGRIPD